MKLKINKDCDLSSISVFPPHARRSSAVPTGPHAQASQLQSQQSQQSFSQGLSSQHGMFSQLSQNSVNEALTNDQGIFVTLGYILQFYFYITTTRQLSYIPSQISEELEHRIGLMETSLSRFGMILDSVQSDVMQLNKGMKEVSLEMDSIRQKLIVLDKFLQSMVKPSDVMFEIWFLLTRLRYDKPEQGTRRFES